MSMLPVGHLFIEDITPLRRVRTGDEDGTPIYVIQEVAWPDGLNGAGYVDIEAPSSTQGSLGTTTTQRAMIFMEPEAAEELEEDDQLRFSGHDWRIEGISRPIGLWGPRHTEISVTRQVNP